MRYSEIFEAKTYTPKEAKEIGDCAIVAISNATNLPWEEVYKVAQKHFYKFGMNAGGIYRTFAELGWGTSYMKNEKSAFPIVGRTVRNAELYINENFPEEKLICSIYLRGIPHSIVFVNGKFENVQGAYKAKIRDAEFVYKK